MQRQAGIFRRKQEQIERAIHRWSRGQPIAALPERLFIQTRINDAEGLGVFISRPILQGGPCSRACLEQFQSVSCDSIFAGNALDEACLGSDPGSLSQKREKKKIER